MVLEAAYKSKATYNSARQCYVTNVVKNNRVVNNNFADSVNGSIPVLSDSTSATTSTSTQVSRSREHMKKTNLKELNENICGCSGQYSVFRRNFAYARAPSAT